MGGSRRWAKSPEQGEPSHGPITGSGRRLGGLRKLAGQVPPGEATLGGVLSCRLSPPWRGEG